MTLGSEARHSRMSSSPSTPVTEVTDVRVGAGENKRKEKFWQLLRQPVCRIF